MKKLLFLFSGLFLLVTGYSQIGSDELGTIIIWRSGEFNHPNLRNRVALNDDLFSNLSKRNYIRLDLPPGKYELEVGHIELITNDDDEKWVHPDEGGIFPVTLKAGITYNIIGEMKRMDPGMDSTVVDDNLRYYVELERYRGSYNFLQHELSVRTLAHNRDFLYSRVELVTHSKRKMKAVVVRTDEDNYIVMELGVGYLYEQTIPKSDVRSITRIMD
jgi:hypothetical protein